MRFMLPESSSNRLSFIIIIQSGLYGSKIPAVVITGFDPLELIESLIYRISWVGIYSFHAVWFASFMPITLGYLGVFKVGDM